MTNFIMDSKSLKNLKFKMIRRGLNNVYNLTGYSLKVHCLSFLVVVEFSEVSVRVKY